MRLRRRDFLAAGVAFGATACARSPSGHARAQVLVVGGGFGGATTARYVRRLSGGGIDVTLVEPERTFVSCPLSNLVLGGSQSIDALTSSYASLARTEGVRLVRATVVAIDVDRRRATLDTGDAIAYDRLVLSPGVELLSSSIEGLAEAQASGRVLQAWRAGPETRALRRQLEAMPDGGTFAISIPEAPYRCPPGPYERACQVASYFRREKPRSKVLILDENADVVSKGALFRKVWADRYPGMVEYRPRHQVVAVDARDPVLHLEVQDDVRADVMNVIPPMRAARIAFDTGLANANGRWCRVDYLTFESTAARHVHVLGDAVQGAPLMPKSGHMANGQAKVVAAAIVADLLGLDIDPAPVITNTCYSFVDETRAIHVASVHAYVAERRTFETVPGSGGVSLEPSELEGRYAWNWARTIWNDTLG